MTKFDETPEERKINAMGKKALDEGLVRAVFTDQADGSTGGDARLMGVRAGVDAAAREKMETRGGIVPPDGGIHNWLPFSLSRNGEIGIQSKRAVLPPARLLRKRIAAEGQRNVRGYDPNHPRALSVIYGSSPIQAIIHL
jgi:hypothetical protein